MENKDLYAQVCFRLFFFLVERCFSWLVQNDLFLIFIIIRKSYTISLRF